jgi:hypothetical protein
MTDNTCKLGTSEYSPQMPTKQLLSLLGTFKAG